MYNVQLVRKPIVNSFAPWRLSARGILLYATAKILFHRVPLSIINFIFCSHDRIYKILLVKIG